MPSFTARSWQAFCDALLKDRVYLRACARRGFAEKYVVHVLAQLAGTAQRVRTRRHRGSCWKLVSGASVRLVPKRREMYGELQRQQSLLTDEIGRDATRTLIHYDAFETNVRAREGACGCRAG